MSTTLITAPVAEPVTLAEAKAHLNITASSDDTLIGSLIQAAREHLEQYTRRALIAQTWDLKLNFFSDLYEIPYPPLISVTSVKYIDADGTEQTLASSVYTVDTDSKPGRIYLAYGQVWPTTRNQRHAVTVRFVAGYVDSLSSPQDLADNVPQALKQAMLLHIGHLYEHREAASDFPVTSVPMAYEAIIQPYRILHQ